MNIRASLIGLLVTGTAFGGELNVQGGSSTGGNSQVIVGRMNGACRFSVTGAFNDTVTVKFGPSGGNGGFSVSASGSGTASASVALGGGGGDLHRAVLGVV